MTDRELPDERAGETESDAVFALRGRRLFDGHDFVGEPVLTIRGRTIATVGVAPPVDVTTVDLGDVTLLPGLIDTHQHLCFDGSGTLEAQVAGHTDDELRERARSNAARALRGGITTIRDLGDRSWVTLDLRGDPALPTILAAGPPITSPGGHCWFLGGGVRPGEVVNAVKERHQRGCDVVKIMVTGGALTPTSPMWESQFTASDIRHAVAEAHALGLPVAAHCHGIEGIAHAVDAGVDTIEHCTFFTERGRTEVDHKLLSRIAERGIVISATLGRDPTCPMPPLLAANRPHIIDGLKSMLRTGGTVVAGTDAGINPSKPHDVLPLAVHDLAEIGLDGRQTITTLTATAAAACGVGDHKGLLAPGFDADVIAVAGDPVANPTALQDNRGVWRSGRRIV